MSQIFLFQHYFSNIDQLLSFNGGNSRFSFCFWTYCCFFYVLENSSVAWMWLAFSTNMYCVERLALRKRTETLNYFKSNTLALWYWYHLYFEFVSTYINSLSLTLTPTTYYFSALIYNKVVHPLGLSIGLRISVKYFKTWYTQEGPPAVDIPKKWSRGTTLHAAPTSKFLRLTRS